MESDITSLRELLIRLDERTQSISLQLQNMVTQQEFQPVKAISYGLVSLVMVAVVGALISMVLKKKKE